MEALIQADVQITSLESCVETLIYRQGTFQAQNTALAAEVAKLKKERDDLKKRSLMSSNWGAPEPPPGFYGSLYDASPDDE